MCSSDLSESPESPKSPMSSELSVGLGVRVGAALEEDDCLDPWFLSPLMLCLARLGGLPMRGLPPAMVEEDKRGWCDKR